MFALALLLALQVPSADAALPAPVFLHGTWRFQLGDHQDWAAVDWDDRTWADIRVPDVWESEAAPGYDGFAWYRRTVRLPAALQGEPIGLMFGTVGDAFEVYWNGVQVGRGGRLPPRFVESVDPTLLLVPAAALRLARDDVHTIAVRVYNDYAYGGIFGSVVLGRYDVVAARMDGTRDILLIAFAVFFLAIGVYHLAFFARRRASRENLHFALVCAAISGITMLNASVAARAVMPAVNPYRLELLLLLGGSAAFVALLQRVFDLSAHRLLRGLSLFFVAAIPIAAALPLRLLARFHGAIDAIIVIGLVALVLRLAAPRLAGAAHRWPLVAGTAVLGACITWDVLAEYGWVAYAELLPNVLGLWAPGFLAFVLGMGLTTAERFALAELHARTDPLTGLARRHVFEGALQREIERLGRAPGSLAVVLVDLDHFKQVNDRFGHRIGDLVLEHVGRLLRYSVRNIDVPARLGGEEFGVLLTDTTLEGGRAFAERLRRLLAELEFPVPGQAMQVTASFGVVATDNVLASELLLDHADQLLYRAKTSGRDQIVAARIAPSARRLGEERGA